MLDAVYESGCTNWDTADVYGDSEELIGNWYELSLEYDDRSRIYNETQVQAHRQTRRDIHSHEVRQHTRQR